MPSIRRSLTAIAAAGTLLALASCSTTVPSTANDSSPASDTSATRIVATDNGDVTIPADAQRVVVLNSNLAGYFYSLDITVAATLPEVPGPGGGKYPDAWSEEATEDKTVILPWGEDGFDFEAILSQKPDVIVAGGQGYSAVQAADAYERLNAIAPTVIVSKNLLTWQEQLGFIAKDIFDDADGEKELLAAYDSKIAKVKAAIALPPTPVNYLVSTTDGTPFSLPETSALPQTMAELGFTPSPVIADNPEFKAFGSGDSFELSTEQVSQVFTAPTVFVFGFYANDGVDIASLEANPAYAGLPAFAKKSVYQLPTWAYRADYIRTMDLLDYINDQFTKDQ